jgi:predicted site-specific integrase-resolvase
MEHGLRIGEIAHLAGVNVQTLRYYERRGLIAAPARRAVMDAFPRDGSMPCPILASLVDPASA